MSFAVKLEKALGLLEAKNMVYDDKKPDITKKMYGWTVLIYDDVNAVKKFESETIKRKGHSIIKKVQMFLEELDDLDKNELFEAMVKSIGMAEKDNIDILHKYDQKIKDIDSGEDIVAEALQSIIEETYDKVYGMLQMGYTDSRVFKLDDVLPFYLDHDLTPYENFTTFIATITKTLKGAIIEKAQQIIKTMGDPTPVTDEKANVAARNALMATDITLRRIQALGIRKSVAIPIRLHLVNKHPKSGHGDSYKAADASSGIRQDKKTTIHSRQDTHKVNIYVTPTDDMEELVHSLAHEIGHILFASSKDVQALVKRMSSELPSPSNYGRTDYVYRGASKPILHHTSGNEWMAELFAAIISKRNLKMFNDKQLAIFKAAISSINGHPHAGIVYKDGQA